MRSTDSSTPGRFLDRWFLLSLWTLAATFGASTGCASSASRSPRSYEPGPTALDTYASFAAAFAARDFGAVYDLSSPAAQARFQSALDYLDAEELEEELDLDLTELRAMSQRDAIARLTDAVVARNPADFERLTRAQILGWPAATDTHTTIRRQLPDGLEDELQFVFDPERGVWLLDDPFFGE